MMEKIIKQPCGCNRKIITIKDGTRTIEVRYWTSISSDCYEKQSHNYDRAKAIVIS